MKPGNASAAGRARLGDGVADLGVGDALDAAVDEADLADADLGHLERLGREHAELLDLVVLRGGHEADLHARLQRAVEHAHDDDHAAIRVVPGIEDQRLQRRVGIALGRRHPLDHRLEDLADAAALLGAGQQRPGAVEADDLLDLPAGLVGLGAGQVDSC